MSIGNYTYYGKIRFVKCPECTEEFHEQDFGVENLKTCAGCDQIYCWECYLTHKCEGHAPEAFRCMTCGVTDDLKNRKVFKEEDYCVPCFDGKKWERKYKRAANS